MSIVAECPHCETRFNLQPDLVGKSMRCPNPDCRQVFTVQSVKPVKPARKPGRKPAADLPYTSGDVGDMVPVVEAELVPAPLPPDPSGRPDPLAAPPKPPPPPKAKPRPPEPQVVEATVVAPPPVKEVVWSAEADLPGSPPDNGKREAKPERRSPVRAATVEEEDDPEDDLLLLPRRKKRKSRAPLILTGMLITTVLIVLGAVGYLVRFGGKVEGQEADQALEMYKNGKYAEAAKAYDKLANENAGSEKQPEYRFFADLASLRVSVGSVTNSDNPEPSLQKFRAFLDTHKSSPLAKRDQYGHDIFETGKKLVEDMATFVGERVSQYRGDRTKLDELRRAEEMIAAAKGFIPQLEPFRDQGATGVERSAEALDRAQADVGRERLRIAVFAEARELSKPATDERIEQIKALFSSSGFADEAEAKDLIRSAELELAKLLIYANDPRAQEVPPESTAASIVVVAPIGGRPPEQEMPPAESLPTVFLAVARGVLYALDEDTGRLLWAVRVGADVTEAPAVARVELAEGPTELALVTSNVAGHPALSGYLLRTGTPRWHQPLPAAPAGAAVVVGTRAYLPVRDAIGTIYEFDLTTGARVGRFALGQPVGPGATLQPGSGRLFVAADARRVFVFDVDAKDDNGDRLPPRCSRVLPTGHAAGTLRTPPVVLGPAGDAPGQRWLVLAQADGAAAMKLRVFPHPPPQPLPPDAPPILDPIAPEAELPLPGWAWFPPVFDGERLGIVTDLGHFRLFGVNQPGNTDRGVFPLPFPPPLELPPGTAIPGLVFPAEEGSFWALTGGGFQQFRLMLHPKDGLTMAGVGSPVALGVPIQPAQMNARRDTVCLVVRSVNSSGCRAVAVRVRDGEVRWQRQLGAVAAASPTPVENGVLLADEDGEVVTIPAAGLEIPRGATRTSPPEWIAATPPDAVAGPTVVAASADGKTVYVVTPTASAAAPKLVIRRATGGLINHTGMVTAPAALAGPPAVLGDSLLLPLADGFVYRVVLGDGKSRADSLAPGPRWLTDRRATDPAGFVVAVDGAAFVTSDGGKVLTRWNWPAGANWSDGGAKWEVRERIASPPLVLPAAGGRPARLLVADTAGSVWLYPVDRSAQPLRRWVPGRTAALPAGRPTKDGFALQTDAAGRQVVTYVVDGKRIVSLDADRDLPLWVTPSPDDAGGAPVGLPRPAANGRWLVTELGGRVLVLDGEKGDVVATRDLGLPGAVPAAAGAFVTPTRALVPLSDGSAAVVEFPAEAPPPKGE